ncbi:hypothetical protein SDC9_176665 [bioreactor metagenome]|uniref:Uncharacterized protein n=1 Tax=bioreactor metagenome TaxID=1076179 RepID=A0A645GYT9_9ZZZZ
MAATATQSQRADISAGTLAVEGAVVFTSMKSKQGPEKHDGSQALRGALNNPGKG